MDEALATLRGRVVQASPNRARCSSQSTGARVACAESRVDRSSSETSFFRPIRLWKMSRGYVHVYTSVKKPMRGCTDMIKNSICVLGIGSEFIMALNGQFRNDVFVSYSHFVNAGLKIHHWPE